MNKYFDTLLRVAENFLDKDTFKNFNREVISETLKDLMEEHQDEILAIITKYGKEAPRIIMDMFSDEEEGANKYYDATQGKSATELLGGAFDNFRETRKNKEKFKKFLENVGSGAGIILQSLLKTVNPLG